MGFVVGLARAAEVGREAEPERMQLRVTREEGPVNVRYVFLSDRTGERVARLRIGHIKMAYGKQGIFRVAWKPKAVLQGVELQIIDAASWPTVSDQLADTLGRLAARGTLVMQDIVIERVGEPQQRVEAPTAEFTPAGDLVLPAARLTSGAAGRLTLILRGPQAGNISLIPSETSTSTTESAGSIPPTAKSR